MSRPIQTYPTLEAALAVATIHPTRFSAIIEIEHATAGRCWVLHDGQMCNLARVMSSEPERYGKIVRLISEQVLEDLLQPAPAVSAREAAIDRAETAAFAEIEGTPLRSPHGRPNRTCTECGSPVYGEFCTHCFES